MRKIRKVKIESDGRRSGALEVTSDDLKLLLTQFGDKKPNTKIKRFISRVVDSLEFADEEHAREVIFE